MRRPLARLLCAQLLPGAAGLRAFAPSARSSGAHQLRDASLQIPIDGIAGDEGTDGSNRQELTNFEDMQYFTRIRIGGQEITGIIDTGSFELVIFEHHCSGCGYAGMYSNTLSTTCYPGPLEQRLYYGSGDVLVHQAFDLVSVGTFRTMNQSFWNAVEAHMPVLQYAKFQSIVGMGPPETPANDFWVKTSDAIGKVSRSLEAGIIPPVSDTRKIMDHLQASMEMSKHRTLLSQYNVRAFSLCLGRIPGSSGFFVWNDTSPFESPSLFKRVAVIGRHTWTVNLTQVHLSLGGMDRVSLGCSRGCGAVIDSGTSLLMMPSAVVDYLEATITDMNPDCDNLKTLPELTFSLDGHRFTLPPDSYLAKLAGPQSLQEGSAKTFVRSRKLGNRCQLTVMESYSDTHWGPLWIIGMPFFRKYYTSFSVGRNRAERSLFIAPATAGCTPSSAAMTLAYERSGEFTTRQYNISHMYLSPLVRQAAADGFVHL